MISARVPSPIWMGRFTRIALAALLVSLAVPPHAFAQQELTFSLFERYIDALRVQANIPGMSAAIVQDERVTWTAAFGYADVEHSIAARADTPYHISGLTEALSSALLLEQCVETAHAGLDERIQQSVPSYGESATTMRDLLSHKSPGSGFKYDASRYATGLTPLAEDCVGAGTPFRQALWERIFQRLGMLDSVPAQNVDDSTADDRVQFDSAELDRFTAGGVKFVDGHEEPFDAVVLATGYAAGIDKLFPDTPVPLDRNGMPLDVVGRDALDGVYFIGFDLRQPGGLLRTIGLQAQHVAAEIARRAPASDARPDQAVA